ncbi:siderophore ABC transporter substrate-binding protein [Roseomonas marmotae]|uniref:Siderophore ABC transporter substrate-binding protein n=1 Tax=Roseomonas marmotae TaxID=2768161 RepID=A0ABS3KHQ1_9PROT|nr:siderophore ABC transporter substrate-binding protein [Roseomonas marmotae]MBO1076962.1 siderophore ABC transporter substrate-binding protein [Roseomonas marmotae]QTI80052.1 siderophore ABC transporter substrate-binding protein [Roseomonas marmotae]
MPPCLSRRLTLAGLAGGAGALLIAGGAAAREIRVPHAKGETVLPGKPKRVAVYDLAALDMLQALGVEVAGVPGAHFPAYLSRYAGDGYARIGTLFEPDEAALRALRPDLIIVAGRSSARYEAMQAIAPTIDLSTGPARFVPDVAEHLRLLGRIFGRQEAAEARASQFLAAVEGLRAKSGGAGSAVVLFVAGPGMAVQLPGSRFGIVHDVTGLRPVVAASEAPAPAGRVTGDTPEAEAARRQAAAAQKALLEKALGRDPDWILVLDRAAATGGAPVAPGRLEASEAIRSTTAWKKKQVIHLDAPAWYLVGGGVAALEASIGQIGAALDAAG